MHGQLAQVSFTRADRRSKVLQVSSLGTLRADSHEQLISTARGQNWILSKEITTYVPLWERMDGARLWTLQWLLLRCLAHPPQADLFSSPWHTLPGLRTNSWM